MLGLTDDGLARLRNLPFDLGGGPFHIKGSAYRAHLEYCDEHVAGGNEAVCREMGPQARSFFSQPFLPSSMYDIVPLVLAGEAAGRVTGVGFLPFVDTRTRQQARYDLRGVYRLLARVVSDVSLAKRIPMMMSQYLDFGTAKTQILEDGTVCATLCGIPVPLAPWWTTVTRAYVTEGVQTVGRASCDVAFQQARINGNVHGVDTADLDFRATIVARSDDPTST